MPTKHFVFQEVYFQAVLKKAKRCDFLLNIKGKNELAVCWMTKVWQTTNFKLVISSSIKFDATIWFTSHELKIIFNLG